MTEVKAIPTFENEAVIEGEVLKHDLQVKELNGANGPYNAITGRITLKTGENETHTSQYFVKELKKDGNENGIYKNVKTVLEDLVSLEDIAEGKVGEGAVASKVRVKGNMALNEYYANGQFISVVQPQGVFLNRVKSEEEYSPKATFDVEAIVATVVDEYKLGEETGRKIVKVLVPTFNGAIPLELIAKAGADAEYIESNFEPASTVNLYGNIINFSEKIVKQAESEGFGQAKEKVEWKNVRELLISGGSVYDEESPKTLSVDQIKKLQAARNEHLASLESRSQQEKPKEEKKSGFGNSTPAQANKAPKVDMSKLF